MKRWLYCLFICIIFLSACRPTSPTPIPDTLYVDPGTDLGSISPYMYGSNFGPWTAVPAGKLDLALDSHITVLRFPGGEWGDANNLMPYQIDTFIAFCEQVGAIPTISVRLLGGTPETAAELVQYVNGEKGYNVRYWSIGNEPDLYEGRPNVDYDTVRFNQEWRDFAEAMKAADPEILLLGPEVHGTFTSNFSGNPKDVNGLDWMSEFLKANGDLVDIVTYHRYPFPRSMQGPNATIDDLRRDLPEWTRTIQYLRQLIQETTGRDLPIGVTEAGSHYSPATGGEGTPDSFFNAIWWADAIGRLINEDVFMVNQWLLTTSSTQRGGLGLIAGTGPRPTYYVYQMYQHFGTEQVYAASGIENVSVYAAKRDDGTLTIMIINLTDVEQNIPLKVKGLKLSNADVWRFDVEYNAENLGEQSFADGIATLPAQSISLYVITP
jgi:hypothetical protein